MSHYSKCMEIKVHFSHFVCVSGVAFLRLTDLHKMKEKVSMNLHKMNEKISLNLHKMNEKDCINEST